ncbi:MAG: O-antigen ligase family protein [Caldilineaceae bacterium]
MVAAAPFFYFPQRFPAWGPVVGLLILAFGWGWRRYKLGCWRLRTPADWPLLVLLLLLPLAVWVPPTLLRDEYSYPRALILAWNIALFSSLNVHSARSSRLRVIIAGGMIGVTTAIALAALFGTRWENKLPFMSGLLSRLPRFAVGAFGAEYGFSPNQLAGTILYALPFAIAWFVMLVRRREWQGSAMLACAAAIMFLVLVASQSRAGLVGFVVGLAIMALAPTRWGRWVLGICTTAVLVALLLPNTPAALLRLDDTTKVQHAMESTSIAGRFEIWSRAVQGLQDFPLTGVGLGAFRGVIHHLYPSMILAPDFDVAHAHNFFLQTGLDFGVVGLAALLAIYMLAAVQIRYLWRSASFVGHRYWAIGLFATLAGQTIYSMFDAVAMGSKTNLLFWWLLGIIFGISTIGAEGE